MPVKAAIGTIKKAAKKAIFKNANNLRRPLAVGRDMIRTSFEK
jgi:hypothetical protein